MTNTPEIQLGFNRYLLGAIRFPHVRELPATRTFDGVALTIPAEIELNNHDHISGRPMVSDVWATVTAFEQEVGVAEDVRFHVAECREPIALAMRLSANVVRALESRRAGGPIPLVLQIEGQICVIRDVALFRRSWEDLVENAEPVLENGRPVARPVHGEPLRISASVSMTIESLVWSNMLTATGFGENVFVEIPLPPNPGPPWDDVWKALRTARDALNRGGSTAWKLAVSECRVALEKWQDIEAVDHGDGGLTANRDQREARTVIQRRDALRWHAHQLAHYFQHNHADECTRDDAVLVLATLAGLLAVRKP